MNKKEFKIIIISLVLFAIGLLWHHGVFDLGIHKYANKGLFLITYLLAGYRVLIHAGKNILKGKIFDENFLMAVASIGALALGQFEEAVAVMIFYSIGEFFEEYSVNKSRNSIKDLMKLRPDYANLLKSKDDVDFTVCDPDDVSVGSFLIVNPGEKVPIDGIIVKGDSSVDTSLITGESMPREVVKGDDILSGFINLSSPLIIQTTSEFEDSTISKILELVSEASTKKANIEKFITKFAKYYTPFVVISATLLCLIPTIVFGVDEFSKWVYRALLFLVISCPCAIVISVPLSFFGGIGCASKNGILVKGSNYLEALSKVKNIAFDKTGTLTKGEFNPNRINTFNGFSEDDVLYYIGNAEFYSKHPIALSIKRYYKEVMGEDLKANAEDVKDIRGKGISCKIDGKVINIGNESYMKELNNTEYVKHSEEKKPGDTVIYLLVDNKFAGSIFLSDTLKEGVKDTISELTNRHNIKTFMLTGDNEEVGKFVGSELNLSKVYGGLLPEDKVNRLEEVMASKDVTAFIGDGVNDAPVLARADIGISMGAMGSDAAIEASNIVIMEDDIEKLPFAIKIAKKTSRIAKENISFALTVKALIMLLGALGYANMWAAVFADVGVSFIAILNSMRALKFKG